MRPGMLTGIESGSTLEYAFDFMEAAFYNSQEMVMFRIWYQYRLSPAFVSWKLMNVRRYIRYNRDLLFEDASQADPEEG